MNPHMHIIMCSSHSSLAERVFGAVTVLSIRFSCPELQPNSTYGSKSSKYIAGDLTFLGSVAWSSQANDTPSPLPA